MFCHVLPLASSVIVEGRRFLESVWQWILVCLRAVSRSRRHKLEKVSRPQTLGGVLRRVTVGLESLINIILVFYYVLLCSTMFHSVSSFSSLQLTVNSKSPNLIICDRDIHNMPSPFLVRAVKVEQKRKKVWYLSVVFETYIGCCMLYLLCSANTSVISRLKVLKCVAR